MKDATKEIYGVDRQKVVNWKFQIPAKVVTESIEDREGTYIYSGINGTIDDAKQYALQLFKMYKERLRENLATHAGYYMSSIVFYIEDHGKDFVGDSFELTFHYEALAYSKKSNAWRIY